MTGRVNAMMSTNCDRLATDTDLWSDNRSAKTQANYNAHGGIVHFQSDTGEWQRLVPAAGPKRARRDETGTLNAIHGPMQDCVGSDLVAHIVPDFLHS